MKIIKKIEAVITLSPSTCYFMRTGKCSLNMVSGYYISHSTRVAANDLLYCPRLYKAMGNHERLKPIALTPCQCGHAEVVSGHQRACIASQKGMRLSIRPVGDHHQQQCSVCGGQMTFEKNNGCQRLIGLRILLDDQTITK